VLADARCELGRHLPEAIAVERLGRLTVEDEAFGGGAKAPSKLALEVESVAATFARRRARVDDEARDS
jgi:hypothetical protein